MLRGGLTPKQARYLAIKSSFSKREIIEKMSRVIKLSLPVN